MPIVSHLIYRWKCATIALGNWDRAHLFVPPNFLGRFHARMDSSHGNLKVYASGLQPLWHEEAKKLLRTEYQVEYLNINFRDNSGWNDAYELAYNKIALAETRHKFGVDIFNLCMTKAESDFRHRMRAKPGTKTA